MTEPIPIAVLPTALAFALGRIPLPLLRVLIGRLVTAIAGRHPALFVRLGEHANARFLIEPTDLPLAFRLCPRPDSPRVEILRRPADAPWDARITGPLAAMLGMVHGALDGDALFFSGDIAFEGDTEAILALRNAIDDAEIDLAVEIASTLGPFSSLVERLMQGILPVAGRLTGVALSRARGYQG